MNRVEIDRIVVKPCLRVVYRPCVYITSYVPSISRLCTCKYRKLVEDKR